ncbi:MAG TPA: hypothetical protein VGB89_10555, partial [Bacteroidota bacterium]
GISNGTGTQGIGVRGSHAGSGWGVFGSSPSGRGVYGETTNGVGVRGQATSTSGVNYGVWGETASVLGTGVHGFAPSGIGVKGVTNSSIGIGVRGEATATSGPDAGVYGTSASANGSGVFGVASSTSTSGTHYGVRGMAQDVTGGFGVRGDGLIGVYGDGTSYGVYSFGNFGASGLKSFQIDHPVDPKNKYLNHYCAEGAEPLNAYSGNTTLDARGSAIVKLPEYFDQINKDFRYQLTPVGSAAPNLHIAEEIQNNRFRIAGGNSGQKISWRVEALRNDLWVRQHGAPVDVEKSNEHRGKYLQPELFGQPMELGIHYSATPNEEVDASRLTQAREAMRTIPEPSPRKEQ